MMRDCPVQSNGTAAAAEPPAAVQHAPATGPRLPPGWLDTPPMAGSWAKLIPVKVKRCAL